MKLSWLVLAILASPSLAFPQSLGEAAAKEKARRKQVATKASPAPVYNNDNVTSSKGSLANDPTKAAPEQTSAPPQTSAPASSTEGRGKDEALWRRRYAQAVARLDHAKQEWEKVQNPQQVGFRQGMVAAKPTQALYEQIKTEMQSAQQALDNIMEEGRRAGIPPGWLR